MNSKLGFAAVLLVVTAVVAGVYVASSDKVPQGPLYFGKIVFGNSADPANTKQFIVRDRSVFLDENYDDLPQPGEKIDPSIKQRIQTADSELSFDIVLVDLGVSPDLVSDSRPQKLILYVDVVGDHKYQMTGQLNLSNASQQSDWLHFGGPLQFLALDTVALTSPKESLQDIKIYLGTTTDNSAHTTVVVPNKKPPFPKAKIRFEPGLPDSDSKSVVVMDHFC